jgi:hypothetical protein
LSNIPGGPAAGEVRLTRQQLVDGSGQRVGIVEVVLVEQNVGGIC